LSTNLLSEFSIVFCSFILVTFGNQLIERPR